MGDNSLYVQHLLSLRESTDALIQGEVRRTLPRGRLTQLQKEDAARVLQIAEPQDLGHLQLTRIRRNSLRAPNALSFADSLVKAWASHQVGATPPGLALDNKMVAYDFIDRLGARRPEADKTSAPLKELAFETPRVVKPTTATGSRGVFLAFDDENYIHVKDRKRLHGRTAFEDYAKDLIRDPKWPVTDRWFSEELILEDKGVAARDLKFYAFYGQVEIVLEYVRFPEHRVRFWDRNCQPIDTGIPYAEFEGVGFTQEDVAAVEAISKEIPRPYMRIDMLRGQDEVVFGEFTPRSGDFEKFSTTWDIRLGEAWAKAEHRIMTDLLDGKEFTAYTESVSTDLFEAEIGSGRSLKG